MKNEIDTLIRLKYGPPSHSASYIRTLPIPVINHVFQQYVDDHRNTILHINLAEYKPNHKAFLLSLFAAYAPLLNEALILYNEGKLL